MIIESSDQVEAIPQTLVRVNKQAHAVGLKANASKNKDDILSSCRRVCNDH